MSKEQDVKGAVLLGLHAGNSPKEISNFNNIPLRTVYNIKSLFEEDPEGVASARKRYAVCQEVSCSF
ncbi:hypothetical protein TCAL_16564 [Tigriopus californicus]|uniref:HTH psq-type domain-containing protein n=1 Tax=Tigriopus californicus TaxID=6832 RepID=A0A553NFP4_TIGCA|nr:hypothetical protein TCAL_16564 [Tigriopus californicus]